MSIIDCSVTVDDMGKGGAIDVALLSVTITTVGKNVFSEKEEAYSIIHSATLQEM
jgi:hypothetical protein